ncbi:MAG: S1 RNA-binding domain-containing protein [Clostridia bacterium]|nr:S1 RNA-binding domain-containing protein [Clostridia bacterium]
MINSYKPEGALITTAENREYLSSLAALEKAMLCGKILEAPALLCDSSLRLHVDLGGITGIIEREEAVYSPDGSPVKDIAIITRVGKPVCFKVIGIDSDRGKPTVRLSRRAAQLECVHNHLCGLLCGDILPARVTHLEKFGAFVDIGCGVVSLLSIDCISVSRISHPSERLTVGMPLWVIVKTIDRQKGRIFVSGRELLGTWEENAASFEAGQTVAGIIRSVEPYGIFVELTPNLAGLAELRSEDTAFNPEAMIGQYAAVYIKSIIPERMKIKLVLVDSYHGEPRQQPLRYFIDGTTHAHLDYWRYSPECSPKIIETVFESI